MATEKRDLNKFIENISWGLFLIMIGCIWLVPASIVPNGTWLIGVGAIMLGLNAARYLNGIKMSAFTIVVGGVALLVGLGDFAGRDLPVVPIVMILIGLLLVGKVVGKQSDGLTGTGAPVR
jgi:hypothetical protein